MGPQPPPFSSQEYWETRFQHNTSPFDWLLPAGAFAFDKHLAEALSKSSDSSPEVLHIGSGTSLLSFHLKNHVKDAGQIHNVDFSKNAVQWGVENEDRLLAQGSGANASDREKQYGRDSTRDDSGDTIDNSKGQRMRWTQVDLLSLNSVLSSSQSCKYSLVVDKSCCDAIACGEDVECFLPFVVQGSANERLKTSKQNGDSLSRSVHPVILLALHLALLTPPGARWVAISYSSYRFSFITQPDTDEDVYEMRSERLPVPSDLWRLVCMEPVETTTETSDGTGGGIIYRPPVSHWIYVFERTNTVLKLSDSWMANKLEE